MNFRRILANAIARRIAFVLVAAALAWMGIGKAHAQQGSHTDADQGVAMSHCWSTVNSLIASANAANPKVEAQSYSGTCSPLVNTGGVTYGYFQRYKSRTSLGAGQYSALIVRDGPSHSFPTANKCSARTDHVGSAPYSTASGFPVQGSITCSNGCTASWYNNGDGTWTGDFSATSVACTEDFVKENCADLGEGWTWNSYAGVCQPPKDKCAANQTRDATSGACVDACPAGMTQDASGACVNEEAECPAGNVKSPTGSCLPGDGQCAAGEARRENGTCGKDSDGDGQADEDDDNPENDPDKESASGGDGCAAPPSCSGSAIACMQVKIQWRIDCNTRKVGNISGGTCSAVPVCTGENCDAMQYAQLLQQWRAACALEKLAGLDPGGGEGDNGVVDLLTGPGSIDSNAGGGDSLEEGSPWGGTGEGEEHNPDATGYGYSRSCPSPPSFTLPDGQSISIDLGPLCNWVSLGGTLVLLLSGLLSLRIVAGSAA